ncbi:MAG: hypothetical protein H6741_11925 [Alphaproteobacteria bacterium]|nr:hypothetical protein [Alphaproteobacteria bacterium]MCB9793420.1 hypothetical protein [Alphaproteobacteria bacterium]
MLRNLLAAALLIAPLAMPLNAAANAGWDYEWEFAPTPWKIDAMDWVLEVQPQLTEAQVVDLLPPPDHNDYCTVAGCTDADRMDEFVLKLFNDDPPANLPSYPLGCGVGQCIWSW